MEKEWSLLPRELLLTIFNYLDANERLSNLSNCQLVCKNWVPIAQRELYKKITVETSLCLTSLLNRVGHLWVKVSSLLNWNHPTCWVDGVDGKI